MMKRRSVLVSMILVAAIITSVHSTAQQNTDIQRLLDEVPDVASWQDLSPQLRARFEANARATLARDRREWGLIGLEQKLARLMTPTPQMRQNIDRVLSRELKSELPDGFTLDRDVAHADLKRALIRIYLSITARRSEMLHDDKESKGWDGRPIKELGYFDHEQYKAMRLWSERTLEILRSLDASRLTAREQVIFRKAHFRPRLHQFDRPHVAEIGDPYLASLYKLPPAVRPFATDSELLLAYNAAMFSEVRSVDRGTLQSFVYNHGAEFDKTTLKDNGMSDRLVTSVMKLGNLFKTRVLAHPDRDNRCTVYSAEDRAKTWDALTGRLLSNPDGAETMESYAKRYQTVARHKAEAIRELAKATLNTLFPPHSPELDATTRADILRAIEAEARPAAVLDTMTAAMNKGGSRVAASKLEGAIKQQAMVGGYESGGPLRKDDERQVVEMWQKIRTYLRREYAGYRVDIAALVPDRPTLSTELTLNESFASSSGVTIGLKSPKNKASLYSTLLHEIKHLIDYASKAVVEGAAWEGAATAAEQMVWPRFIDEAMAGESVSLPVARLLAEIETVRFTATTDATLQVFLRRSCEDSEPDTVDFVKKIVAGYGYDDEEVLLERSARAHNHSQYLEYDYGRAVYIDLMEFLQAGVGPAPRVDPFLLQACGMPSPKKNEEWVSRLRACVAAHRQ